MVTLLHPEHRRWASFGCTPITLWFLMPSESKKGNQDRKRGFLGTRCRNVDIYRSKKTVKMEEHVLEQGKDEMKGGIAIRHLGRAHSLSPLAITFPANCTTMHGFCMNNSSPTYKSVASTNSQTPLQTYCMITPESSVLATFLLHWWNTVTMATSRRVHWGLWLPS